MNKFYLQTIKTMTRIVIQIKKTERTPHNANCVSTGKPWSRRIIRTIIVTIDVQIILNISNQHNNFCIWIGKPWN